MKVSKKRLIEIVTEEISRVRKEGHRGMRAGTIGGGEHRKMDPHEPPRRRGSRRRKPVAPRPEPSPEEKRKLQLQHADSAGYNDGFVYGHSKNRASYEHDPELVAVYNKRNELGLERHRAFHGAKNKKVSEGYGDYERGASNEDEPMQESFRFMSKNQIQAQINQAEIDGDDAGRLTVWYPEDITANEAAKFMYGHSSDPKYWGEVKKGR